MSGGAARVPRRWGCELDPLDLYSRLRHVSRATALLHTASGGGWSYAAVLAPDPGLTLESLVGVRREIAVAAAVAGGEPPWSSGRLVVLPYELAGRFERVAAPAEATTRFPELLSFGVEALFARDNASGAWWFAGPGEPGAWLAECGTDRDVRLRTFQDPGVASGGGWRLLEAWSESPTPAEYEAMVARARDFIAAGDIFQVNLARWFSAQFEGDPFGYFEAVTRRNPSPYAAYVEWPDLGPGAPATALASSSPELLVRVRGNRIETRPIAGTYPKTRPRGDLPRDPKERAEHVMLVDLERNDLGRLAVPGTVKVEEMLGVEEYSHLYHIVSHVAARLRPGVDVHEILRATFPGGTITGAPKVRAMEIIAELERRQRGLYTGSIGWVADNGDLELNIAIRTAVIQGGAIRVAAGAGIVADSRPEKESAETTLKAAALLDPGR